MSKKLLKCFLFFSFFFSPKAFSDPTNDPSVLLLAGAGLAGLGAVVHHLYSKPRITVVTKEIIIRGLKKKGVKENLKTLSEKKLKKLALEKLGEGDIERLAELDLLSGTGIVGTTFLNGSAAFVTVIGGGIMILDSFTMDLLDKGHIVLPLTSYLGLLVSGALVPPISIKAGVNYYQKMQSKRKACIKEFLK